MPLPTKLIKILVLSNKIPYPLKDGGAIATYNMLQGFAKLGSQITLLTFNTKKHYLKLEDFPKDQFKQIDIHTVYANTTPKVFSAAKNLLFSSKPYILERFNNKLFKKKLEILLKNNTFDIIQIEGLYLLQYSPFIRTISSGLIAYRAHNIEYEIWSKLAKNTNNLLLKYYLNNLSKRINKYEKTVSNLFDLLVPISENDDTFFKQSGNLKPNHICPVGFDFQADTYPSKLNKNKHLYFIGSLDWRPNREAILWFIDNCWQELKNRHPYTKLYIAGRNAPEGFAYKINHIDIIFEGEVEDASKFISDKAIIIVPLQSGSGMRVKIIEAFLHKKAVVSSTLGAIGTKSTDNKQILIADTAKEFVDKTSSLLENDELYERIITNAYHLVSANFDIFKRSNSLLDFYKQELKKQN